MFPHSIEYRNMYKFRNVLGTCEYNYVILDLVKKLSYVRDYFQVPDNPQGYT